MLKYTYGRSGPVKLGAEQASAGYLGAWFAHGQLVRPDPDSHLAEEDRMLLSKLREVRADAK